MNSQHMIKEVCICKMNLIGRKSKQQGKKKKKEAKRENGPKQSAQCNLVNVVCINQFSHKKNWRKDFIFLF